MCFFLKLGGNRFYSLVVNSCDATVMALCFVLLFSFFYIYKGEHSFSIVLNLTIEFSFCFQNQFLICLWSCFFPLVAGFFAVLGNALHTHSPSCMCVRIYLSVGRNSSIDLIVLVMKLGYQWQKTITNIHLKEKKWQVIRMPFSKCVSCGVYGRFFFQEET